MKKAIILAVAGVLSFVVGTAGIYLAMPTIAPAVVDSTRVRLDSLGLLPRLPEDDADRDPAGSSVDPLPFDTATTLASADSSDSLQARSLPTGPIIEFSMDDSLRHTTDLLNNLKANNAALTAKIEELTGRIDQMTSQKAETEELSKSLSKLEDRQLAGILADLDLSVVETLYLQSSGRDRSRLLQNLPPERAARFVKTLVKGPGSSSEVAAAADTSALTEESNQ